MKDYIRKAIELADGFDLTEDQLTFPSGHYFTVKSDTDIRDWMLDALAAQLVRQVDETMAELSPHKNFTLLTKSHQHIGKRGNEIVIRGPDRTMNTIKAIVDSGILT